MIEETRLAQDLIRQLGVDESNFYLDPFSEPLNLKSNEVKVTEDRLSLHAEIFSLCIRIRQRDSKSLSNVLIEKAIRCACVYLANDIRPICSKAKPNLKQWEPDVIATRAC